jgi:hypothetical protein
VAGKAAEVDVHPLAVGLGVVVLGALEVLEVCLARLVFVLVVSEVHLVVAVGVSVWVWMFCM